MHLTVTLKFEAESKAELINQFPTLVKQAKADAEEMKKQGVFGPPSHVHLRFLVIGGGWRGEAEKPEKPKARKVKREETDVIIEE